MRIVFFIDHLRADGTQHFLRQLVAGLAARGHVLAIVCLNDSWDAIVVEDLQSAGAEIRIVGQRALVGVYGIVTALIWLRARHFDALVTLLFTSDVLGRLLGWLANIRLVVSSIRARNTHYAWWQRLAVRLTMPLADLVVLNSANASDFAVAHEGVQRARMVVIPNGVAVGGNAVLAQAQLRAELGLPSAGPLLGSVGRLTHQKGFDVLLHALALLPNPDCCLVLFGTGEEQQRLQNLADTLGIRGRVAFAGYRHDAAQLLGALDVYVHPARFEGMPNALLEAMAAGRPIVATNVDGNRELICDQTLGWLVPPDDATVLAQQIASALENPTEAQRRGMAAQARAIQQFGITAMVDAWERVLRG
jgi:glycosyltransferase involved in cell wall biosynthesis